MATVTGLTYARALEILGQSVVSGAINGSNHLILTRQNGSSFDAGDVALANTAAIAAHAALATGVHGVGAGQVVGTTLAQTLTNKALTGATVTGGGSVVGTTAAQTLSSKTLTAPVLNTADINDGTIDDATLTDCDVVNPIFSGEYIGRTEYKEKTADQNRASSTAYADVTATSGLFSFVGVANAIYELDMYIPWGAGAGGMKLALAMPAGALARGIPGIFGTSDEASPAVLVNDSDGGVFEKFENRLIVKMGGTGGTVKLQMAQVSSNAANTTVGSMAYWTMQRLK